MEISQTYADDASDTDQSNMSIDMASDCEEVLFNSHDPSKELTERESNLIFSSLTLFTDETRDTSTSELLDRLRTITSTTLHLDDLAVDDGHDRYIM